MVRQSSSYKEDRTKQSTRRYHEVDGTSARVPQTVPEYEENTYDEYDEYEDGLERYQTYQEKKRAQRVRSRRRESTKTMDAVSLLMLCIAVAFTFYTCISYIRVQADVTMLSRQVAQKESELDKLSKDNVAKEEEIARVYDLDYVYRVATKELGMVFPEKDQVIEYNSKKSEYVKQFEKIPSSDKTK